MKTLKMTIGASAMLLTLVITPVTSAFASSTVPVTQVASQSPITAGSSRSECLTPNFDDTGLAALQTAITSFESLTNSTVTCVSAYLNSATSWAQWDTPWITQSMYGYTSWVSEAPQTRQLILEEDLIPSSLEDISDPLSWEESCASGAYDTYATQLGTNLVAAGLQNSIIRLGAEMNGNWEADFIGTTTQEQNLWATCFANEVTALRQAAGENFLIDWDPNAGKGGYLYTNFYPGNAYVDIMGLDLYDVDSNSPNTSATFSQLSNEPFGFADFEAFAAAQGKPMSLPEWGLSSTPSGDDPGYINGMASTVANGNFAFETYFDTGSGSSLPLSSSTPLSLDAYQEWFGTPSAAATISGTVTAVGSGDLAGICVEAFLNGTGLAASTTTAGNGTYTISGLAPDSYGVFFLPGCGSGDFATQWYNDTASGTQTSPGTLIAVTPSTPATGINAAMSTGASISGTVTAATGAGSLAGICVNATPVGGSSSAGVAAVSAPNGTYVIEGLLPGSYDIEFSAGACGGNYVTQWYNGTSAGAPSSSAASAISTSVATPASGINAVMSSSTSISGTVTAAAGGATIGNMCVWAYPVGGGPTQKATTALDGVYVISGIAPGNYTVEFYTYPCGGKNYVTQWYDNTSTGAPSSSGASTVSTSVASLASGINAGLVLAASITGTVTAAVGGADVAGVCISVNSTDGGIGASTVTAAGGAYTVYGLAADSYDVVADPTCGGTVTTSYASPQPTSAAMTVTSGEALTYSVELVQPGTVVDYITLWTTAPGSATVGGATYSPSATATSGDHVVISLDGASTGCALNVGVVSFTAVGTCIIDFNDPSSGASDAYTSATQEQQSIIVAASSGGGGGGGTGIMPPSPPVSTAPAPPIAPPTTSVSIPTPREITYTETSTALSPRAKNVLNALVKRLSKGSSLTIIGYALDNKALARERAEVVAAYLVSHLSVRITIKVITTSMVAKVKIVTTKV